MTTSVASFPSMNNQHHLDDLSGYWASYSQDYPPSSMSYATPTHESLHHAFSLDPTLQSSSYSSFTFVDPGCLQPQLQSFPTTTTDTNTSASASGSPVSVQSFGNSACGYSLATKTKRRKSSSSIEKQAAAQHAEEHDTSCHESQRKKVAEPVRRERNRNAAAKCRAKGKAAEEVLKDKQRRERERNQVLRAAFEELSTEVLALKHEVLSHSVCNHSMIDGYLRRSAAQISRGMSTSSTSSQASAKFQG